MPSIRLRFVTCSDRISTGIRFAENFWSSHCEAVMPDGTYLGAHADGGVQARLPDYDAAIWTKQLFIDLPCTEAQQKAHIDYLTRKIGEPYDMESILGFALRLDQHSPQHIICSALQLMSLRQPKAPWLPFPITLPAHQVSPRDLLLILSGIVRIVDPEVRKPTF
jgi:hypothetical protein